MYTLLAIPTLLLALCTLANAQIRGIKISGDTCTSQTLSLQAEGTSSSPYFSWNFGDPASGTRNTITITGASPFPFPSHTFSSTGVYNVCVSFQEPGSSIATVCRRISVGLCCNGIISAQDSCLQNRIPFTLVTSSSVNSVNWDFGDPSSSTDNTSTNASPSHQFSNPGQFTIKASVNFNCGIRTIEKTITITSCDTLTSSACLFYMPKAFSPNNDAINDLFSPVKSRSCLLEEYELLIFNRWGEVIYQTTNPDNKWDGKYRHADCPVGVYSYLLKFKFVAQLKQTTKGTLTLLR
ncbi:gliding motility-associated C-terminal domain-containing protein [Spirosoma aerophilum]